MEARQRSFGPGDAELTRQELKALRERNLKKASFKAKASLVGRLGIRADPSKDLRSRRIACRLNLTKVESEREHTDSAGGSPFSHKR